MKIPYYIVVWSTDLGSFQQFVNDAVAKGYEPIGGIVIDKIKREPGTMTNRKICQAMILKEF